MRPTAAAPSKVTDVHQDPGSETGLFPLFLHLDAAWDTVGHRDGPFLVVLSLPPPWLFCERACPGDRDVRRQMGSWEFPLAWLSQCPDLPGNPVEELAPGTCWCPSPGGGSPLTPFQDNGSDLGRLYSGSKCRRTSSKEGFSFSILILTLQQQPLYFVPSA